MTVIIDRSVTSLSSDPPKVRQPSEHDRLVDMGARWLRRQGCIVATGITCWSYSGETPDVFGVASGFSALIECKTSRGDFLADRKKRFRQYPGHGMGDFRMFLCPAGLIRPEDLIGPLCGWGILYARASRVYRHHNVAERLGQRQRRPFIGSQRNERAMMYSMLRRTGQPQTSNPCPYGQVKPEQSKGNRKCPQ